MVYVDEMPPAADVPKPKPKPVTRTLHGSGVARPAAATDPNNINLREQLFNAGDAGPMTAVSLPADMITRLNGIMLDIDGAKLSDQVASAMVRENPEELYFKVVKPWLGRHPLLKDAEVRVSGSGLHLILWLGPAVEFRTDGDRQKWAGLVRVVQHSLPADPDCPGITALTRPVGSINGKTGVTVRRLVQGRPVTPDAVLAFCESVRVRPFATIVGILYSPEALSPCPVCRRPGSRLGLLDHVGKCYGHGQKITLADIYSQLFAAGPARGGAHR